MSIDEELQEKIAEMQELIVGCVFCQAPDKEAEDGLYWINGVKSEIIDLLAEYEVPEEHFDIAADQLTCKNGCDISFGLYDSYGKKPDWEIEHEQMLDEKFDKWDEELAEQLDDFQTYMIKYPYLGASHPFGEALIKGIHEFPKIKLENEAWYRARNISEGRVFEHEDMAPPQQNVHRIGEGRFNHYGQSHWYLANMAEAAGRELLPDIAAPHYVWIQKIFIQEAKDILDLRKMGIYEVPEEVSYIYLGLLFNWPGNRVVDADVDRDKHWKPEYFIPRFIADIAKQAGFSGIAYSSNHHYTRNLVVFDETSISAQYEGEPELYKLEPQSDGFPFFDSDIEELLAG